MPKGSDYHPYNINRGGNRIFDNTSEVDQANRNRPNGKFDRLRRRAEEQKKGKRKKEKPGRRRK